MRYAAHEVAGAIEWINDPGVLRVLVPGQTTLLAEEAMLWIGSVT